MTSNREGFRDLFENATTPGVELPLLVRRVPIPNLSGDKYCIAPESFISKCHRGGSGVGNIAPLNGQRFLKPLSARMGLFEPLSPQLFLKYSSFSVEDCDLLDVFVVSPISCWEGYNGVQRTIA